MTKDPLLMIVGEFPSAGFVMMRRCVYDPEGICPSILAAECGERAPKIIVERKEE